MENNDNNINLSVWSPNTPPPPPCHFLDYCSLNSSIPYFDKDPKEGSPLVFQNCHNFKIGQFVFFGLIWGGVGCCINRDGGVTDRMTRKINFDLN